MIRDSHPTLPEFDYVRLKTLAETSRFLKEKSREAVAFNGGTDMLVRMRDGVIAPKFLVEIKHLEGMQDLVFDPKLGLTVGAAISMNRIVESPEVKLHYPILAEACRTVASYQLRNRATLAGNICNASPAGDSIGACLLYGSVLEIHGEDVKRELDLSDFFLGPGKSRLSLGEIVTKIRISPPAKGTKGMYVKLGRNHLGDLAIVGVTVLGYPDAKTKSGFRIRIALTSVSPTPLVPIEVENYLSQASINPETISKAAGMAANSCSPINDVRASALYRKQMVRNLTTKALTETWHSLLS